VPALPTPEGVTSFASLPSDEPTLYARDVPPVGFVDLASLVCLLRAVRSGAGGRLSALTTRAVRTLANPAGRTRG